jgi:crotonobetainyl-CoA:carnitine CoA-transferase CaiB-like acyl-CoA transferase
VVQRAQALGVPAAKYRTPDDVLHGAHERARGLFAPATLASGQPIEVLRAPFQFRCTPLEGGARVPALDEMAQEIAA